MAGNMDRVATGGLVGEPRDHPGQRNARGHVVVDPDHIRAQTRIDRNLIGAIARPGGRDIPVEVRHGSYPCVVPAVPGPWRPEKPDAKLDTNLMTKTDAR